MDISFYNHVYLNPYDGKITYYWAEDMNSRLVFPSFDALLTEKEPFLLLPDRQSTDDFQFLALQDDDCNNPVVTPAPAWMFGTEIYSYSRLIKQMQYDLNQNVVRIWNDDLLQCRDSSDQVELSS